MEIDTFDWADDVGTPETTEDPDITAGMHRVTIEQMDDGFRVSLIDEEGNEAVHRGLRGVSVRIDGQWVSVEPDEGLVQETVPEGDLVAALGEDGVLRVSRSRSPQG